MFQFFTFPGVRVAIVTAFVSLFMLAVAPVAGTASPVSVRPDRATPDAWGDFVRDIVRRDEMMGCAPDETYVIRAVSRAPGSSEVLPWGEGAYDWPVSTLADRVLGPRLPSPDELHPGGMDTGAIYALALSDTCDVTEPWGVGVGFSKVMGASDDSMLYRVRFYDGREDGRAIERFAGPREALRVAEAWLVDRADRRFHRHFHRHHLLGVAGRAVSGPDRSWMIGPVGPHDGHDHHHHYRMHPRAYPSFRWHDGAGRSSRFGSEPVTPGQPRSIPRMHRMRDSLDGRIWEYPDPIDRMLDGRSERRSKPEPSFAE